ncbi:hypothetical protein QBK99_05615 [Corticibacterium sp. UT-5YL-CI-8]|nr:hypothetical protein [Tianweitania sp. UT-5YL-CI-8]
MQKSILLIFFERSLKVIDVMLFSPVAVEILPLACSSNGDLMQQQRRGSVSGNSETCSCLGDKTFEAPAPANPARFSA